MKVVEQGRHGGSRCEFVRLRLSVPAILGGQADVRVLVLPVFETANLLSGTVFGWFFGHVLPVPSCIAVCLSGGVLAWDGLK